MLDTSRKVETLTEVRVLKIGRKYLTVKLFNSEYHFFVDFSPCALVEKTDYSVNCYLFSSEQKYKDYKEIKMLEWWLQDAASCKNKYTLNQLRKVREILENEEITEEVTK